MPHLELYHFEYFDPLRKRWLRARYVASREAIAARHPQHRLVGEPEIRELQDRPDLFMGYSKPKD
jgi:hypothetical protein